MSDYKDETVMLKLPADYPIDKLMELSKWLEHERVFVPGFIPPEIGLYNPIGFFYASEVDQIRTVMLLDRNVTSRMAQLAKGEALSGNDVEQRRTIAGILAFAQFLNVLLDPSVAFHELAPTQGNEIALEEFAWFRVADEGNAYEWLDVALGNSDKISTVGTLPDIKRFDLVKPLKRWRRNYIAALKIAALELISTLTPIQRVMALMDWMFDDFILAGPAAMFACVYFAPKSPPRGGLLKQLKSTDRERAIAGIRNAAWDITHVSELSRHVLAGEQSEQHRFIFVTMDVGLRAFARLVIGEPSEIGPIDALARQLSEWWPDSDAMKIAERWFHHTGRARNKEWWDRFAPDNDPVTHMIADGERTIRDWAPQSKSQSTSKNPPSRGIIAAPCC